MGPLAPLLAPILAGRLEPQRIVIPDGDSQIEITIRRTTVRPAPVVRLSIDGRARAGRTDLVINDERRSLQDCRALPLLGLVAAHDRDAEAWSTRRELGIPRSRNTMTYVREPFRGLVPPGFEVIEGNRRGGFRLNPALVVERVAWDALAEHAHPGIAKLARERLAARPR